jgi:phosphoribosyl 1,2-cyclic phosphodiesterase/CheY-like chemotaxis protein
MYWPERKARSAASSTSEFTKHFESGIFSMRLEPRSLRQKHTIEQKFLEPAGRGFSVFISSGPVTVRSQISRQIGNRRHRMKAVLLIEDDEALRPIIAALLEQNGWKVLEAQDGEMGLNLARLHKPDVVVCDLLMPRCNGYQVCRAIRATPDLRHTRIVMISGRGYATDKLNALEAGADEYLVKPVEAHELRATLRRLTAADFPTEIHPRPAATFGHGPARLRFWGVRGSIASPGPGTVFYGGNTSCVEVRADDEIIVLDAGTGIRPLGLSLAEEFKTAALNITLLLTHTHWDHIQGFPFFLPAYDPKNTVRILGYEGARQGLAATLGIQMESPYFPVGIKELPGNISIEELRDMEFAVGKVQVQAMFVNHPGICVGYRLNTSTGSIVFIPDNEPFHRLHTTPAAADAKALEFAAQQDEKLISFIRGAEVLIMDSQYDRAEYESHAGWGHACVDDVAELAARARVKQLFLFHHDPTHNDERVSRMLAHARQIAGNGTHVEAAREGLEVVLKK